MKENRLYIREKRLLGMMAAGFLLGRVWLFQINPFAVAFFSAMCAEKRGRKGLALAVLAGMMSSASGIALFKYLLLFSEWSIFRRRSIRAGSLPCSCPPCAGD